ncbi:MAG: cell wall hydrolase [Sphingomonas sp.]|nr:cell wall hydrolase [Sphingomonas sp.]
MRWASGIALGFAACLGYSGQAAIRAIIDHLPEDQPAPARGYEAQDHFPGAALLYDEDAAPAPIAAPAPGATGTAPLPALPAFAAALPIDTSIRPAAPFSVAAASPLDRGRALDCLATAVYYEAASEPDAGQRAVAQVVLNRVRHPAFPNTVCGVVYQGSERAGCQFSFACDGAMARAPSRAGWARALRTAALMLGGFVEPSVGEATHYHTYAVTPAWNRQMVMTAAIGAHFFHRWQGFWGTPAAFTRAYHGGEPFPGPHARIAAPAPPAPMVAALAVPATPVTPPAQIQPAYAESGTPVAGAPTLPESQILDKWKDSGKPLR